MRSLGRVDVYLQSTAFNATEDSTYTTPSATFDYCRSLPESEYSQVLVSELPIAKELREFWDAQFQDPRQPDAKRFGWDPWYVEVGDGKFGSKGDSSTIDKEEQVPGERVAAQRQVQYSLKRTMTSRFLEGDGDEKSGPLYDRLVDDLVGLGTSVGLTAITPPWISLYTDGDMQNYHTDAPHGPLAFVLSLCREGDFSGGETMMLKPQMLEYWRGFDGSNGIECGSIVRYELLPSLCHAGRLCANWSDRLCMTSSPFRTDSFHQHRSEDVSLLILVFRMVSIV